MHACIFSRVLHLSKPFNVTAGAETVKRKWKHYLRVRTRSVVYIVPFNESVLLAIKSYKKWLNENKAHKTLSEETFEMLFSASAYLCVVLWSLESALCFIRQLSWAGAAAWQLLLFRAASQKHPYKCYCAHLIDLSQAQSRPDGLAVEGNGKDWLVNRQVGQCLQRRRLGCRWPGGSTLGLAH